MWYVCAYVSSPLYNAGTLRLQLTLLGRNTSYVLLNFVTRGISMFCVTPEGEDFRILHLISSRLHLILLCKLFYLIKYNLENNYIRVLWVFIKLPHEWLVVGPSPRHVSEKSSRVRGSGTTATCYFRRIAREVLIRGHPSRDLNEMRDLVRQTWGKHISARYKSKYKAHSIVHCLVFPVWLGPDEWVEGCMI